MSAEKKEEEYAVCGYCGKPCGKPIGPKGKVYHWECAFEACKERREVVLKEKGIK